MILSWNFAYNFDYLFYRSSSSVVNLCHFLYTRLQTGRILVWWCPSVRVSVCPSVRHSFLDFSHTCFDVFSLHKKFFRSQAQRAGNGQILEAQKKLHRPELFFAKALAVWKFWNDLFARDVFYSGTHFCLWLKRSAYLPLFTFKERNSGLFCPMFLKFTFDNFTSPVGLVILKFYLPGPNFTSLGHRACTIFRRLCIELFLIMNIRSSSSFVNFRWLFFFSYAPFGT